MINIQEILEILNPSERVQCYFIKTKDQENGDRIVYYLYVYHISWS